MHPKAATTRHGKGIAQVLRKQKAQAKHYVMND